MATVFTNAPVLDDPMKDIDWVDPRNDPDSDYWEDFVQSQWPDTYDSCKWRAKGWDD